MDLSGGLHSEAQQQSLLNTTASEKTARVSEANGITQAWQTQLLLDIITDVSGAPNLRWPVKPE